MQVKRNFEVFKRGGESGMRYTMQVTVNGKEIYSSFYVPDREYQLGCNPPAEYIDQHLKHTLMRAVQDLLFGVGG
jgi:hypothetical protein